MLITELLAVSEGRAHSIMIINCGGTFDKNFLSMCLSNPRVRIETGISSRIKQINIKDLTALRSFTESIEILNNQEFASDLQSEFSPLTSIFVFGLETFWNPFEKEGYRPLAVESISQCLNSLSNWASKTFNLLCVQACMASPKAPKAHACLPLKRFAEKATCRIWINLEKAPGVYSNNMQATFYSVKVGGWNLEGDGQLAVFMPFDQSFVNILLGGGNTSNH